MARCATAANCTWAACRGRDGTTDRDPLPAMGERDPLRVLAASAINKQTKIAIVTFKFKTGYLKDGFRFGTECDKPLNAVRGIRDSLPIRSRSLAIAVS